MGTTLAGIVGIVILIITFIIAIIIALIPVAVAILLNVIISKHMERAAIMKGHVKSHAFALSFWFGVPGYIYTAALPDLNQQEYLESIVKAMQTKPSEQTS